MFILSISFSVSSHPLPDSVETLREQNKFKLHLLDRSVAAARIEAVRSAELFGQLEFPLVKVDREDTRRLSRLRRLIDNATRRKPRIETE